MGFLRFLRGRERKTAHLLGPTSMNMKGYKVLCTRGRTPPPPQNVTALLNLMNVYSCNQGTGKRRLEL